MCVVPVRIKHGTSKVWGTYAVLESCSQGTFLDGQLLDELNILERKTTVTVKILDSEVTEFTGVVEALKVTNGAKKKLAKGEMDNNTTKNLYKKGSCSGK